MTLSAIVAMTRAGVIGVNNQLPWHLPADLKRFKQITLGHPIIMGRKTFSSIGKALPGRRNIVISRQKNLDLPGADLVPSLNAALELVAGVDEAFVIGGAEIFAALLPQISRFYITWIDQDIAGDTYFPAVDWSGFDAGVEERVAEPIPHRYVTYNRKV